MWSEPTTPPAEQKQIAEVNSGAYCFETGRPAGGARAADKTTTAQGEYYLTDTVSGGLLHARQRAPEACTAARARSVVLGANDSAGSVYKLNEIARSRVMVEQTAAKMV